MPLALVVGGASCVWQDVEAAMRLATPDAFFVINDMIPRWPHRLDYVTTLHPDKLDGWLTARKKAGHPAPGQVWAHRHAKLVDKVTNDWAGSSGLFAVKLALELKFSGVILAGVPMTPEENHFVRQVKWSSARTFRNGWQKHLTDIKHKVRSMSGWTKSILGEPTPEWLVSIGSAVRVETANGLAESNPRQP